MSQSEARRKASQKSSSNAPKRKHDNKKRDKSALRRDSHGSQARLGSQTGRKRKMEDFTLTQQEQGVLDYFTSDDMLDPDDVLRPPSTHKKKHDFTLTQEEQAILDTFTSDDMLEDDDVLRAPPVRTSVERADAQGATKIMAAQSAFASAHSGGLASSSSEGEGEPSISRWRRKSPAGNLREFTKDGASMHEDNDGTASDHEPTPNIIATPSSLTSMHVGEDGASRSEAKREPSISCSQRQSPTGKTHGSVQPEENTSDVPIGFENMLEFPEDDDGFFYPGQNEAHQSCMQSYAVEQSSAVEPTEEELVPQHAQSAAARQRRPSPVMRSQVSVAWKTERPRKEPEDDTDAGARSRTGEEEEEEEEPPVHRSKLAKAREGKCLSKRRHRHSQSPEYQQSEGGGSASSLSELEELSVNNNPEHRQAMQHYNTIIGHPMRWVEIYTEMRDLEPGSFIGHVILATHLLKVYLLNRHVGLHFMDCELLCPRQDREGGFRALDPDQIVTVRRDYMLPPVGRRVPVRPVVCLVWHGNHFFTAVFDFMKERVFVFGRKLYGTQKPKTTNKSWASWHGPVYWRHLITFYGWEDRNFEGIVPKVVELNWQQHDNNCGPTALQVVTWILNNNDYLHKDGRPKMPPLICNHLIRAQLLHISLNLCRSGKRLWLGQHRNGQAREGEVQPNAEVMRKIDAFGARGCVTHSIIKKLGVVETKCIVCLGGPDARARQKREEDTNRHGRKERKQMREAGLAVDSPGQTETDEDEDEEASDLTDATDDEKPKPFGVDTSRWKRRTKDLMERHPMMKNARNRLSMRGRIPEEGVHVRRRGSGWDKPITVPFTLHPPLFAKHSRLFDDYTHGPTLEDNLPLPKHLLNFPSNPYGDPEERSPLEPWRDMGYRLQTSFCHAFNLREPVRDEPLKHFLPPARAAVRDLDPEPYTLLRGAQGDDGDERVVQVDDMVCETMDDLNTIVHQAPNPGRAMIMAYALGRDPRDDNVDDAERKYLLFDLEKDHIPLTEEEVHINVDLDSVIWVTHEVHTMLSASVHMVPQLKSDPFFAKNNHISVEILMPPSEEERSDPANREWLTKSFPLASIPHVPFATIGMGACTATIVIFFPRMIHRHPVTGRRQTLIPQAMQELWLDDVLNPCLQEVIPMGTETYYNFTTKEFMMKGQTTKTMPLGPEELVDLQRRMRDMLLDEGTDPELKVFGSFFFTVDLRGSKLSCVAALDDERRDAWDLLVRECPGLDFDYMLDRENGELYVDMGITYCAKPSQEVIDANGPVTGLWRLEQVQESFHQAGMLTGNTHPFNTFSRYGSQASMMASDRSRNVHLLYRQAYNGVFEKVRNNRNRGYDLCKETNAFYADPDFLKACSDLRYKYQMGANTGYNVRDEVRGSGATIKAIMRHKDFKTRVRKYLEGDPILWVHSRDLFLFLDHRVNALCELQRHLSRHNPPHTGVLTTLILHLLRSVHSNPIPFQGFLRDSLFALNYKPLRHRFGMFVLHNVSFDKRLIDPDIDEDTDDILKAIGVTSRNRRRVEGEDLWSEEDGSDDMAIPSRVRHEDLVRLLRDFPSRFVKDIDLRQLEALEHDRTLSPMRREAYDLFKQFTRDIALTLRADMWIGGRVESLDSWAAAVGFWRVEVLRAAIRTTHFAPFPVSRKAKFGDQRKIAFPDPEYSKHWAQNSTWTLFREYGYMKKYHQLVRKLRKKRRQDDLAELEGELDYIFSNLQCLSHFKAPASQNPGRLWMFGPTSEASVEFMVNPKYYHDAARADSILDNNGREGGKAKRNRRMNLNTNNAELRQLLAREHRTKIPPARGNAANTGKNTYDNARRTEAARAARGEKRRKSSDSDSSSRGAKRRKTGNADNDVIVISSEDEGAKRRKTGPGHIEVIVISDYSMEESEEV